MGEGIFTQLATADCCGPKSRRRLQGWGKPVDCGVNWECENGCEARNGDALTSTLVRAMLWFAESDAFGGDKGYVPQYCGIGDAGII